MIISCPECNGTLSTSAQACPHCGYDQAGARPPETAPPIKPDQKESASVTNELIAPSRNAIRAAMQRQWAEWSHDSFWPMAFGVSIVLAVLGILALMVSYLKRAGN